MAFPFSAPFLGWDEFRHGGCVQIEGMPLSMLLEGRNGVMLGSLI